jgi:DNA-binding beta-propeller fold protein YncE
VTTDRRRSRCGDGHRDSKKRCASALPALCLAIGVALVCCPPASALIGRGHVLAGTLEGSGASALVDPTGVAVDEASGEVYVVDRNAPHQRVERFKPDGEGGYTYVSSFAVKSPEDIAVDNADGESQGDVYVVGAETEGAGFEEHDVLYKYDPNTSKMIFKKTVFHSEKEELALEDIDGIAVDASGTLWVDWGEEGVISGFSDAETNQWQPGLTKEPEVQTTLACRAGQGLAVAPGGGLFYVPHERQNGLEECPEEESRPSLVAEFSGSGQLLQKALDNELSSGVAVEQPGGDVYVDNEDSIAAFTPEGYLIQHFGSGELNGGGALAVNAASSEVLVAEPAAGKVQVFAGEGGATPTIDSVYAEDVEPGKTNLFAEIDPHGATTEYEFQYGTSSCVSVPSPCAERARGTITAGFGDQQVKAQLTGLTPNTTYYYRVLARNDHGATESAQAAQTFFTTLPSAAGLLADHREWELVSPAEMDGAAVEPISREGALIQASASGGALAWTASSPVAGEAQGNRRPEPVQVISMRTSQGWTSRDITTQHDRGEGIEPGEATEYRFFSPDLSLALVQPQVPSEPLEDPPLAPEASEKTIYRRDQASGEFEPLVTAKDDTAGSPFGGKLEFAGATPDLSHVVFSSEVQLLPEAGDGGLYEWEAGAALKLISVLPGSGQTPAIEPNLGYQDRDVRGAISNDGSRVFFSSEGEDGPLYVREPSASKTIQVNAVQGEGVREPSEEERAEGLDEVRFQDASTDGAEVFFTDSWPLTSESTLEPGAEEEVTEGDEARAAGRPMDLYELDVETGKLVDLTVSPHVGENADVLGTLAGASEDGAYVYFVANGVLAPGAEAGDCPRTRPLLPHPKAECNLYVSEPDPQHPERRQTRLIARLSYDDAPDWGGGNSPLPGDLGGVTSEVSANGRYLAFMSDRELTGYDNVDSNPAAEGAPDEEVYVYDAETGRLVCASCDPSGQPPDGVLDTHEAGEGLGLVVDRPETWDGHWLAGSIPGWTLFELRNPIAEHQSQYLSDSGRLFFDSADALVPQVATRTREEQIAGKPQDVGVENVYEYEPGGEGTCLRENGCVTLISSGTSEHESAFLDASENGDDAFFVTAAELVAGTENTPTLYDARICGTAASEPCLPVEEPPAPVCTGERCRPFQPSEPNFAAPASAGYSGPGNQAKQQVSATTTTRAKSLTRAQKLAAALKACRKLRRKKQRVPCERRAHRAYATRAKPKKRTLKNAASRPRGKGH